MEDVIYNDSSIGGEEEIKQDENKDIDNILYKIKELKFNKKKVKEQLNIDIDILKDYGKNNVWLDLNGSSYHIFPEARKIQFIDGKKVTEKFVYSKNNLSDIISSLKFKLFTVNIDGNSFDSIESEIAQKEINEIFETESINQITKINSELKNIVNVFQKRNSGKKSLKFISDLSLNSQLYYPENKSDEIEYKFLFEHFKELENILGLERNVIYIAGPKGTSKSLFLLNFCSESNFLNKIPLLYINYRELKKLSPNGKKNIFKKEMIYLFFDEISLKDFYKNKPYGEIKNRNLIKFLYDFILNLLNIYENTFRKYILIVIDNFDEEDEKEVEMIKNIINLVEKSENIKKIKLIISGRCKFIYKKQNLYLNNKLDNLENFIYYNIKLNNKNDMNSLPLFHFKKFNDNLDEVKKVDKILKEEIEFCNKSFNLYGMYYSLLYCNREISMTDLNIKYDILPVDYLVFKKTEKETITFEFHNEIFKFAIKKKIRTEIEQHNLEYFLKELNYSRITFGIFEEKLLTLFFSYNKLKIENLTFKEENRLEVYEINNLKKSNSKGANNKFNLLSPVIITQENYLGPNYDLLILKPSINISFTAYFIQIGTDKNEKQILTIMDDLNKNEANYKSGIKKYTGLNISDIKLVFIFDKETQIQIKERNKNKSVSSCVEFCLNKQILFYLFSVEDFTLYSTSDMNNFDQVKYFGEKTITQKRTYTFSFRNNIEKIFNFSEIKSIREIVDNDLCLDYIMTREYNKKEKEKLFKNNKTKFNKENIYIFQNPTDKILIIKNMHYIIENQQLRIIEDFKTNPKIQDFKYNEVITLNKRDDVDEKKIKAKKKLKKK